MLPTVNENLRDFGISHAITLERLKTAESRRILKSLEQTQKELEATLAQRLQNIATRGYDTGPATTQRIKQMLAAVKTQVNQGMTKAKDRNIAGSEEIAMMESKSQLKALKEAVPFSLQFVAPSAQILKSIVRQRPMQGAMLENWWKALDKKTTDNIHRALTQGLTQGEAIPAMTKRVRDVMEISKANANTIVRTSVNHVTTQAREITYQENSDVIRAVQWISALDTRTSGFCREHDHKVYPIGEGDRPPGHPNCRSTTIPITRSAKELGIPLKEKEAVQTRASMNGQVPASMTYEQWLATQPADVQDAALGKRNGAKYRAGTLDLAGKPINKKELPLEGVAKKEGLELDKRTTLPVVAEKTKRKTKAEVTHGSLDAKQSYDALTTLDKSNHPLASQAQADISVPLPKKTVIVQDKDTILGTAVTSTNKTTVRVESMTVMEPVKPEVRFDSRSSWKKSLSKETLTDLEEWSYKDHANIRAAQMGKDEDPVFLAKARRIEDAIAVAPTVKSEVFRGVNNLTDEQYYKFFNENKSKELKLDALTSFTTDRSVAEEFGAGITTDGKKFLNFRVIGPHSGVDVSDLTIEDYQDQKEVLFRKGTRFRITKTFGTRRPEGIEGAEVHLEEIFEPPVQKPSVQADLLRQPIAEAARKNKKLIVDKAVVTPELVKDYGMTPTQAGHAELLPEEVKSVAEQIGKPGKVTSEPPVLSPAKNDRAWRKSLDESAKAAIKNHTGSGYLDNRRFQLGQPLQFEKQTEVAARVKRLDEALATAPITNEPRFRGLSDLNEDVYTRLLAGKTVKMDAISSFSGSDFTIQTQFGARGTSPGKKFIHLKTVGPVQSADIGSLGDRKHIHEDEYLAPRGAEFRIKSIKEHSIYGVSGATVEIEQIFTEVTDG